MITKVYRIAEKNIEINSLYSDVHDYCADYLINAIPDFSVNISLDDIAYEQKRADEENLAENKPIIRYSDGYLEEIAVYRKIAEKMIDYSDKKPFTAHTTNLVPLIVTKEGLKLKDGRLCDLAPTMLDLMNIEKPEEMTGISLIEK